MGIFSLLLFGVFFYFMMRSGCGSHTTHGYHDKPPVQQYFDPVSGEIVDENQGYGRIINGKLYRFNSKENLDEFENNPTQYIENK
jgi:YHS domain-containing protein